MNAETMNRLARELIERATSERLGQVVEAAGAALSALNGTLDNWFFVLSAKTQAQQRLSEAKKVMETTRAEALQEAYLTEQITGRNADERARNETIYLAGLERNGHTYGEAFRAHHAAQVALDQASLDESIASESLSAAKLRCRLVEAQLLALSK